MIHLDPRFLHRLLVQVKSSWTFTSRFMFRFLLVDPPGLYLKGMKRESVQQAFIHGHFGIQILRHRRPVCFSLLSRHGGAIRILSTMCHLLTVASKRWMWFEVRCKLWSMPRLSNLDPSSIRGITDHNSREGRNRKEVPFQSSPQPLAYKTWAWAPGIHPSLNLSRLQVDIWWPFHRESFLVTGT